MSTPESHSTMRDRLGRAARLGGVILASIGGGDIAETISGQPDARWVVSGIIAGLGAAWVVGPDRRDDAA